MPRKSEVYTWRVSPATKASLEEEARSTNRSVARLLDEIVAGHLGSARDGAEADVEQQRRLHARAARFAGCLAGTGRRSERVRELVRARLKRRRANGRQQPVVKPRALADTGAILAYLDRTEP